MIYRPLIHLWKWLQEGVIQNVPEEDALCAFDCHKVQCFLGEWQTCDRRLHKASGVLMPPSASPATGN
jgi:hypothetical protein